MGLKKKFQVNLWDLWFLSEHTPVFISVGLVRYHGREEGHQREGVEVVPVNVIIIGLIERNGVLIVSLI